MLLSSSETEQLRGRVHSIFFFTLRRTTFRTAFSKICVHVKITYGPNGDTHLLLSYHIPAVYGCTHVMVVYVSSTALKKAQKPIHRAEERCVSSIRTAYIAYSRSIIRFFRFRVHISIPDRPPLHGINACNIITQHDVWAVPTRTRFVPHTFSSPATHRKH